MTATPSQRTANAACPAILPHPDGYMVVGTAVPDAYAAEHGANVAPDEAAVLLPQAVMDAHEKPLRDRIARLEAEIAQLPTCGQVPPEFVEKIGFGTPCHLHQGHTGLCRYRQRDVEYVNRVLKACGYEADARVGSSA